MDIYLMTGIAGSGKTTWAKRLVRQTNGLVCMISQDAIREMLMAQYVYSNQATTLMNMVRDNIIDDFVRTRQSFVLDAVQLTVARRKRIVDLIRGRANIWALPETDYNITFVWCNESTHNLEYKLKDPRGMPADHWARVVADMQKNYESPTDDEMKQLGANCIRATI